MKIIVSHSGKQYVHQLLEGLRRFSKPIFITSYWLQPLRLKYQLLSWLPSCVNEKLMKQLKKRFHAPLEGMKILEIPGPELKRILCVILGNAQNFEKSVFDRERAFDRKVAKRIDALKPEIVVGFEMACLETFKAAKKIGATTVLDLAQIHYKEIEVIGKRFPVFGKLFENKQLRAEINRVKESELLLADYILCLSDFACESLLKNGIEENRIFKVNIGFAPETFKAKEKYEQSGKFRYVFAGTITRRKGVDLVVRAFQELNLHDTELLFIGPCTDGNDLLPDNDRRIRYVSYVPQDEMNDLFNAADVFVFPSYLDSWAMVVVEAMACGLPVIVSSYTGAADAVRKGGGFVIEPELEVLKEKMKYLYNNRIEVERLGKEARKVAEGYTWRGYHQKIHEVFEAITSK